MKSYPPKMQFQQQNQSLIFSKTTIFEVRFSGIQFLQNNAQNLLVRADLKHRDTRQQAKNLPVKYLGFDRNWPIIGRNFLYLQYDEGYHFFRIKH